MLNWVSGVLFDAGYNIDSLVVGRTEVEELSRMTVVVNGTAQSVVNVRIMDI